MDLQHTHTIVSYRKQYEGSPCLSHTNFFPNLTGVRPLGPGCAADILIRTSCSSTSTSRVAIITSVAAVHSVYRLTEGPGRGEKYGTHGAEISSQARLSRHLELGG